MAQDVYIVDGRRTPFIKAPGKPNPIPSADLAVNAARNLLIGKSFTVSDIEEVVVGCVAPSADEANIARIIALRVGCDKKTPAFTVARNCASGLQALDSAYKDISIGRHDLVLAGGTEAMSRTPLIFTDAMVEWFANLNLAKTSMAKLQVMTKFRPYYLKPIIALLRGLTDPVINMNMGQTAEKLAHMFNITKEDMDNFALRSHIKAVKAQKEQVFSEEVIPMFDNKGNAFEFDNGVRPNSSLEKLAKLKPVFDKKFGLVTAGNSSQVTDGAAMLLLASKKAIKKHNLKPIARLVDFSWDGLDPSIMGLGPVHAISSLLTRNKLNVNDIDLWEINEAFAAQVLACIKAMEDENYCKTELGKKAALGSIDIEKVNVHGGSIAVGHPVGASGARLPLHIAKTLNKTNSRYGIASLCIGGGQGGAVLIENVEGEF